MGVEHLHKEAKSINQKIINYTDWINELTGLELTYEEGAEYYEVYQAVLKEGK